MIFSLVLETRMRHSLESFITILCFHFLATHQIQTHEPPLNSSVSPEIKSVNCDDL